MEALRSLTETYLDHLGPALAENWGERAARQDSA